MDTSEVRRPRRVWAWSGLLLFAAIAALAGYHYWNRDQYQADEQLVRELQDHSLPAESVPSTAGWPQWRGPRRDGISHETGLRTDWPAEGPPVLWQAKIGPGYSSIAVADGRVVTMFQDNDNEVVIGWDATKGHELWRFPYPVQYATDRSYGPWPRATPTIDGNRVYTLGGGGLLLCLDAANGKEVWRHDLRVEFDASQPRWGFAQSPLVENGLVFVNPGGPNGQSLAAFDKISGKLIWKALDDPAGYSSPISTTAAGISQLLFFTGNALVSVAPTDGKLFWRYPWNTNFECNIATPIVRGDYVFISSGYGKGCALLKIEKDGPAGARTREVYRSNRMKNHFSTSVLLGEHLYGFDDPGMLTCLDFRTGKVVWRERGYGKGSLLAADGLLLVLAENGKLALVEASPAAFRERSAFSFSASRCWSPPVLGDGRLYVRDDAKLVCYDVNKH